MVEWNVVQFKTFLLVLFRMAGLFLVAPFFGSVVIPDRVKVLFAFFLALVLFPLPGVAPVALPDNAAAYFLAVLAEIAVGLLMGFAATLLFISFQMAGAFMGQEMGFSLANVLDPISNEQISIIEQFTFLFALLVYLAVDGHHLLLSGLVQSFKVVPLAGFQYRGELGDFLAIGMVSQMFVIGVKLAAPVVVAVFCTTVAMGFLAKVVPEMNLFILGFSARIVVGMVALVVIVPLLVHAFTSLLSGLMRDLDRLVKLMGPA